MMVKALNHENYFDGTEIQKRLTTAILRLPKKQQMVFNMRYYDELSYDEMSEILGTSVGALKASYHFAVKKIEEFVTTD
jgi:RNA polymerase sigma-70 factor (ECF subfamily)